MFSTWASFCELPVVYSSDDGQSVYTQRQVQHEHQKRLGYIIDWRCC